MRELLTEVADSLAGAQGMTRDDVRAMGAAEAILRAAAEVWPERDAEQEATTLLQALAKARAEGYEDGRSSAPRPPDGATWTEAATGRVWTYSEDEDEWAPDRTPVAEFDLGAREWVEPVDDDDDDVDPDDDAWTPVPLDTVTASDSVSVQQVDAVQLRKGDVRKGD